MTRCLHQAVCVCHTRDLYASFGDRSGDKFRKRILVMRMSVISMREGDAIRNIRISVSGWFGPALAVRRRPSGSPNAPALFGICRNRRRPRHDDLQKQAAESVTDRTVQLPDQRQWLWQVRPCAPGADRPSPTHRMRTARIAPHRDNNAPVRSPADETRPSSGRTGHTHDRGRRTLSCSPART